MAREESTRGKRLGRYIHRHSLYLGRANCTPKSRFSYGGNFFFFFPISITVSLFCVVDS